MGPSQPTTRESALGFTEGVRSGWLTSDLVAWTHEHLVRTERLALGPSGVLQWLREHDLGAVAVHKDSSAAARSTRAVPASAVPKLLEASRQRVLQALRAAITTDQVAFAHAALFAGRVLRDRGRDGRTIWRVRLKEDTALSDQVLALFAADALEYPAAYERDLAVCDVCGAVTLAALRSGSRRGCQGHPFGASDGQRDHSMTPPFGTPLRGRTTSH